MGSGQQRGDTIIEVLISIAIVSLVLAGSYAITNRNVTTSQDTQEHGQALLIVQQQIEGLRYLSASGTDLTTTFPASHCVSLAGVPTPSSSCSMNSSGAACGVGACYTVSITQPPIANTYNVAVTWSDVRGNTAKVSMDYGI